MPLEIKELIVKGIVESDNKTSNVDIVKLIDENYLKNNHKIKLIEKA